VSVLVLKKDGELKNMNIDFYIEYMKEKHAEQTRKQGTPYYLHPLGVSNILKEKGFSVKYQIVGLLHDVIEDTKGEEQKRRVRQEIHTILPEDMANSVDVLTKLDGYSMEEYIGGIKKDEIAEPVKLADWLHNLSELHFCDTKFQEKQIREAEKWYVDLVKGTVFEQDANNILCGLKNKLRKQSQEQER